MKKMKKNIIIGLAAIILLLMIPEIYAENDIETTPIYRLSNKDFNEFLETQNCKMFKTNALSVEYFKNDSDSIIYTKDLNGILQIDNISDDYHRIKNDNYVINHNFVEFINSKEKITSILKQSYSELNVSEWCLIYTAHDMYSENIPLTICIIDDRNENYFIPIEYQVFDFGNSYTELSDIKYGDLNFDVFTNDEYYSKFGMKDAKLVVDNNIYTYSVNIQNDDVYIPMRVLLEQLGTEVIWDSSDESVGFVVNNKHYKFYLKGATRLCKKDGEQLTLVNQWWGYNGDIVNDRIIINKDIVKDIVALFGKSIEIDYDNLLVTIH